METLFYIHASVAVLAMALAMFTKDTIHALLFMVLSLLCLATSMYILSSPLAAALEVIVYAGAIMVLFVFAVMLLQTPNEEAKKVTSPKKTGRLFLAIITFAVFWGELAFVLEGGLGTGAFGGQSIKDIAIALFGAYGFLLEMISFVLLAGLTAAIFVGRSFMASTHRARS